MNTDPYTKTPIIHQGIWVETECLVKEKNTLLSVIDCVERHGYQQVQDNNRMWAKGDKKIVICLVDDVVSASRDYETDTPYLFSPDTLVITDNAFNCPTQFQIRLLPRSFFGIYYRGNKDVWQPDRDFSFSVNRMDDRRLLLMLELAYRTRIESGYVNFNCQYRWNGQLNPDLKKLQENFRTIYAGLPKTEQDKYRASYERLCDIMPYRNYEIDHEVIHTRARCNFVIETYGSDNTVAFSEKIFRVLQLPVPWTLYGGRYAVAYLESLGFDCMTDIIGHNHYDRLKEIEDKIHVWIWFALKFVRESYDADQSQLLTRCAQAAAHNRDLLARFSQQWPEDFGKWLDNLDLELASI